MGHMYAFERRRDKAQRLALAAEDEDIAGQRASRQMGDDLPRHQRRFLFAQDDLRLEARSRQRVAPGRHRARIGPTYSTVARVARQRLDRAVRRSDFRRMRTKAFEFALRNGGAEDSIDRADDAGRVPTRVIAGEDAALEAVADEARRGFEDARLGAAEAVDALLRIADDEDAGRRPAARAAARAGVAREPGVQGVPLQRARVLELVDEEMADARVEPLLNPARELVVAQDRQRAALEVGHVGIAARTLVVGEGDEQRADEPHHALVLEARILLPDLRPSRPSACCVSARAAWPC